MKLKRRDLLRSLVVAPAAIIGIGDGDRKSKYLEHWRKGIIPVGIAGHDIRRGELIYTRELNTSDNKIMVNQ